MIFTDLYALTMAQAYIEEGMRGRAVFSLFVRRLPPRRNYLLACGLDDALTCLETFGCDEATRRYLASLGMFSPRVLDELGRLRFTGDVYAVPEGTPVFAAEPLLEVEAPIVEAQLVEAAVMNQLHLQTVLASKASRVVAAAAGRRVVDFGMRRIHGVDAALKAARAGYIAGVDATSNVAAGQAYGIPVAGTMAHSYVQAHADELDAFRAFAHVFPGTTLLVDTYDTLAGVRKVIALARELGPAFRVQAIRLDSGDLAALAFEARRLLDAAGLTHVGIFASGGLNEDEIARLVRGQAPIDAFGVGTDMGVSRDAPGLDMAYKLVEYAGQARLKLSTGKVLLPGPKQVHRLEAGGRALRDVLTSRAERHEGRPLLGCVMRAGRRCADAAGSLEAARARARAELAALPPDLTALAPAEPPYAVDVSPALTGELRRLAARAGGGEAVDSGPHARRP